MGTLGQDVCEKPVAVLARHRCCRLPLCFDPGRLRADLALAAAASSWTAHFVERNYEGDWSTIALAAIDGLMGHAHSKPDVPAAAYQPTPVLLACDYFREVLGQFQCPVGSVRLLQLGAGGVIKEHTDHDLGYARGMVRLHVPIQTQPEVEFYVEDERVRMAEGECWYVDVSLRHRVTNRSTRSRIHLVLDCELNDWLRGQLTQAGFEPAELDTFQRRGLRKEDVGKVVEQLRSLGTALGASLASALEQEQEQERQARRDPDA